ncbi:MAG TPA: bifunctional diaminohydroxyphosphoribosylaminopyrimidine deaminase/5-amino-6-(5-phosphoribosylamino)uracil reductase RibD [Egibacteraceae bacterium]|nr:bifunctional diaminohydroxyphosphoribosylaminopyrimidine deaminase/5-amino-6-(5-phosphoribosylamino)uracil reductase RibD [Egibacteraceae bacterium]
MTQAGAGGDASLSEDERWMHRALQLAERARWHASPNPAVGCVLVVGGQVVGEGFTGPPGHAHAEAAALAVAGGRAAGATAYVTLEPCDHVGRTGPCTEALLAAGVARVVAATQDPASPGGLDRLRGLGVRTQLGVLEDRARRQNEAFFHSIETGLPFVLVKAAISVDGRIAAADGTSQWLTGVSARQRVHELRAEVDAVLVGSGTVLADDPSLTCRLPDYEGLQPLRVVLDGRARIDGRRRVCDGQAPTLVFTRPSASSGASPASGAPGVEVVELPSGPDGGVDLHLVLKELSAREVRSVLVEGGSRVITSILGAGLCDKLVLHIAPLLLGDAGRPLLAGGPPTLAAAVRYQLDQVTQAEDDLIVTLYPRG